MNLRLRQIREDLGMSLRDFAEFLRTESGYRVSHATIRDYEREGSPPAAYVLAVCEASGADVGWVLTGRGPVHQVRYTSRIRHRLRELREMAESLDRELDAYPDRSERRRRVEEAWRSFISGVRPCPDTSTIPDFVLRSWERSAEAGVEARRDPPRFRRVEEAELRERRRRAAELVRIAEPHLRWLAAVLGDRPITVSLTDDEGIVLYSLGQPESLLDKWHLRPGYDWSEDQMGTNAAGTALAAARPVAVVGPEHFGEAYHDVACTGAPIRGSEGDEIVGALDAASDLEGGGPDRLALVGYVASVIESRLGGTA